MPEATKLSADHAKKLAVFYTAIISSLNSSAKIAQDLGGPFLDLYNSFKAQCNDVLAKLQPTDSTGLALEFDAMLSSLASTMMNSQMFVGQLSEQLAMARSAASESASRFASQLCSERDAEINKRITEGLLIPKDKLAEGYVAKDLHVQLCSEAKNLGLDEGRKEVRGELEKREATVKLMGERRTMVQTCSLPLPDAKLEAILGETPEKFEAAKTTATTRNKFLTDNRVSVNSPLRANVWASEEVWATVEMSVKEMAGKPGARTEDPFAGSTGSDVKRPRCSV